MKADSYFVFLLHMILQILQMGSKYEIAQKYQAHRLIAKILFFLHHINEHRRTQNDATVILPRILKVLYLSPFHPQDLRPQLLQ